MKLSKHALCTSLIFLMVLSCKTQSKVDSVAKEGQLTTIASNISLYDKPLDTIKKYVVGQRWQLIYSIGGLTGNDRNDFEGTYYTLTLSGKLTAETKGLVSEKPYWWKLSRDIFTGDSTYVITGIVQWKVEGINNDTLHLADNYVDGYRYALVRAK